MTTTTMSALHESPAPSYMLDELQDIMVNHSPLDLNLGEISALLAVLRPHAERIRVARAQPPATGLRLVGTTR
jgi:hypothetical protein